MEEEHRPLTPLPDSTQRNANSGRMRKLPNHSISDKKLFESIFSFYNLCVLYYRLYILSKEKRIGYFGKSLESIHISFYATEPLFWYVLKLLTAYLKILNLIFSIPHSILSYHLQWLLITSCVEDCAISQFVLPCGCYLHSTI